MNFSGGKPGAGLLVLRGALGLAMWGATQASWQDVPAILDWLSLVSLALIALLLAGLLTRFTSVSCALVHFGALALVATAQPTLSVVVVMLSIALFLLGPGEYSIDAWLFGRRVVELPRSRRPAQRGTHPNE